jgi:serine/threonine-protein kinase HipA
MADFEVHIDLDGRTRRAIIKEVAAATATWRDTANAVGARAAEITRMASAFEHDDLKRALAL